MSNKIKALLSCLVIIVGLLSFQPALPTDAASTYKDGEYSLPFTVLKGDSDERSMTNDYLVSPAKLIVKDGKNTVQLTLKNSSWWKSFSVSSGGISVISDSNDTRVVQFNVQDLNQLLSGNIHVVVPDIDYDNKYTVRFKFDASGIPSAGGTQSNGETGSDDNGQQNEGNSTAGVNTAEENPPTGDRTPVLLLGIILLGSGVFLARQIVTR